MGFLLRLEADNLRHLEQLPIFPCHGRAKIEGSCSPPGLCLESLVCLRSPPADENVCWEVQFSGPYQSKKGTCPGVISLQRHDLLIAETSGQPLALASPSEACFFFFFFFAI